ncbi:MAG: hypothetical protein RBS57_10540 [Desulforhabdus sp.]|jgi:hypothetical protein|nr:hypothetical protein [Desulforhabdus sp.]
MAQQILFILGCARNSPYTKKNFYCFAKKDGIRDQHVRGQLSQLDQQNVKLLLPGERVNGVHAGRGVLEIAVKCTVVVKDYGLGCHHVCVSEKNVFPISQAGREGKIPLADKFRNKQFTPAVIQETQMRNHVGKLVLRVNSDDAVPFCKTHFIIPAGGNFAEKTAGQFSIGLTLEINQPHASLTIDPVIGINEHDQPSGGGGQTVVSTGRDTLVAGILDNFQFLRVLFGERADDIHGAVGGSVVDDNDFRGAGKLSKKAGKTTVKMLFCLVCRDDYAEFIAHGFDFW